MVNKKKLLPDKHEEILIKLKDRFEKNMNRHKGIEWAKVQARLEANTEKMWSLSHTVFVYHNGAESYYAARGFRGSLRV